MVTNSPAKDEVIETPERHSGGRHLDASRDDVLRDAALKLLAEIGYDRLTVDAIAACAGAGKATIYRRWSGKAELVVDALSCQKGIFPIPNTGSLRGDLDELSQQAMKHDGQMDTQVMIGLASALPHDEELREAFKERMVESHINTLKVIFDRAVERGEIEKVKNLDMVVSTLPALVLYRLLIMGQAPDHKFTESIIEGIILPLVLGDSHISL
jgi:AcrR family transcriptional regulator